MISEAQLRSFVKSLRALEACLASSKTLGCQDNLTGKHGRSPTMKPKNGVVSTKHHVVARKKRRKSGLPKYANGKNFSPASIYYNPTKLFYAQARQNGSEMRTTVRTHYRDPRALLDELQRNGFKIRFVCKQARGSVKMQG